MNILILKALLLLIGAFGVAAWLGWSLAPRRRRKAAAPRVLFDDEPEVAPAKMPEDTQAASPPVSYLDVAAEAFTAGVVVVDKSFENARSPYAAPISSVPEAVFPEPSALSESAALSESGLSESGLSEPALPEAALPENVVIHRDEGLQQRVSSLAVMTPDSIEAAVQQAGSGLEPMRLEVPQTPSDDLTVISGIGPERQHELNELGIFYYWQIAGWSPENVAWISGRILSPQRVARENWMGQAVHLAGLQA